MPASITEDDEIGVMETVKSCGVVVFRKEPTLSFLMMQHANRWDFPKGHVDPGETEVECALRELVEETGITSIQIQLDPQFRFAMDYTVYLKRYKFKPRKKTLVMFLARTTLAVEIEPTEHIGFKWESWNPPHQIQTRTIDPVLHAIEMYWKNQSNGTDNANEKDSEPA